MRETRFEAIQSPLQADLDRIADGVVDSLNVDMALFSVSYNQALVSLGISASTSRSKEGRVHNPAEFICTETIQSDAPILIPDTRIDPRTKDLPLVCDGTVLSYIGVPVHNAEIGAIGAICAVISSPRNWSPADLKYIKAVSLSIENLVLREMYRLESANASNLAAEYDQIIAAFTLVRADPTSIHDRKGRLVFANRALIEHVDDRELQSSELTDTLLSITPGQSVTFSVSSGERLIVNRLTTSSGYHVCQWTFEQGRLN